MYPNLSIASLQFILIRFFEKVLYCGDIGSMIFTPFFFSYSTLRRSAITVFTKACAAKAMNYYIGMCIFHNTSGFIVNDLFNTMTKTNVKE